MPETSYRDQLRHSWNVLGSSSGPLDFSQTSRSFQDIYNLGVGSTSRPGTPKLSPNKERNFIASIYNKIATDVASVAIHHVKTNEDGRCLLQR